MCNTQCRTTCCYDVYTGADSTGEHSEHYTALRRTRTAGTILRYVPMMQRLLATAALAAHRSYCEYHKHYYYVLTVAQS
jgi:hypothetical protein